MLINGCWYIENDLKAQKKGFPNNRINFPIFQIEFSVINLVIILKFLRKHEKIISYWFSLYKRQQQSQLQSGCMACFVQNNSSKQSLSVLAPRRRLLQHLYT